MAVMLPLCRNVSMLPTCKSSYVPTRLNVIASLLRVPHSRSKITSHNATKANVLQFRSFSITTTRHATATGSKPVGRPKAHTGKAPAKRTATTKSTSTNKATTSTTGGRKKTAKKTTKTTTKAKPRAKAKAKPKPKAKPAKKKGPTVAAIRKQAAAKRRDFKEQALLTEPKKLPESAWVVYFVEHQKTGSNLAATAQRSKELGVQYHNLSADEREIKEANEARRQIAATKRPTKTGRKREVHLIKDARLVKRPVNGYSLFLVDRYKSGDMKGMQVSETGKLIAREWKELSASEKKPFNDQATANLNRYLEEHKTVYGTEAPSVTKAAPAA